MDTLLPQKIHLSKDLTTRKTEIRKLVPQLAAAEAKLDVVAASVLAEVVSGKYYKEWGFDSFDAYLDAETGYQRRKAYYLISIYTKVVQECKIDAEKLGKYEWSKVKELVPILTPKNCQSLLDKSKAMTGAEVETLVKERRPKIIHAQDPQPSEKSEGVLYEETFYLVKEQKDNVAKALEVAEEESGSVKKGHLLDLICTDFLSGKPETKGTEALAERLLREIQTIERVYKVTLEVKK